MTETKNVFKYKVGKKWYTFDKSILEPEDLQIFDRADWTDKLKIITIYKDLKETEDDTVNVLSFKKENANKDKRKTEYTAKRDKLINNIQELNKKQNPEAQKEIEKLQKELKDLEIEYADVVNINTANTLNVSSVNTLNLNNIDKIKTAIQDTEQKFNDVKNLLSSDDINKFKTLFDNLKNSNIEEIKNIIKDIKPNRLPDDLAIDIEYIKNTIDALTTSTEETKKQLKELSEAVNSKQINELIDLTTDFKENTPKLTSEIYDKLDKTFDFNELNQINQDFKNRIEIYYIDPKKSKTIPQILTEAYFKNHYLPFYSSVNQKTAKVYKIVDNVKYEYKDKIYVFINTLNTTDPLYENLINIYEEYNKQGQGLNNPGGFLGLKTNKEYNRDKQQYDKRLDELKTEIEDIKKQIQELKTRKQIDPLSEKQQYEILKNGFPSRDFSPNALALYNQKQNLRHSEPVNAVNTVNNVNNVRQPTKVDDDDFQTQLIKVMNRRRADMTPDDLTDDDSEEWAAGLDSDNFENIGVKPIAGSMLAELKEDLKNYGLALNLNIYKKRRNPRSERSEPKRQDEAKAAGIEEAKKIINSTNNNTQYTDLKQLYENLYE